MKWFNIRTVTKKNLQQMKRDPRMIALSIVAPILVTALFGSIFGGDLTHLPLLVINNDKGFDDTIGNEIFDKMAQVQNPEFNYNNITSNPIIAREAVNDNNSQAAIIIPDSFTNDLLLGKQTGIELYISYENPAIANYTITMFQWASNQVMESYFGQSLFSISIVKVYQGPSIPIAPGTIINISLCNVDKGYTKSLLSEDIFDVLDENETADVKNMDSLKKAETLVEGGEARGIIVFSEDFTYDVLTKKEINIDMRLDGAEPQACLALKGVISSSLSEAFGDKFGKNNFNIDEYYYNNPDGTDEPVENITYFTPAILCFIVFFFSFLLTMLSFLRERNQGTMERMLTSPLKKDDVIVGYVLSFSILALIQATSVILTTIFIFDAQIEYNILSLLQAYIIIYIVVIGALGLGIFLSTLAKTEFQILQFIPLVIIPFMLLSGVWAPVETLPDWLKPISSIIPLTYANSAMRDILLRNETFLDVLIPIGILALFAGLMITLGVLKLSKKLK